MKNSQAKEERLEKDGKKLIFHLFAPIFLPLNVRFFL
jgi:hypothetical protein